ncbi:MAG TPA: CHAT domain-containing protein [Micromonosporaceae bacterium]|nr:CHAT domain-containing protein [Micromonosporaceae bacterium]
MQSTAAGRPVVAVRRLKAALVLLDKGVALDDEATRTALRGRVVLSLANAEAERGGVDVAQQLLDQAEKLLPEAGLGVLTGQRGLLLMRTGRAADAVRELDKALARLPVTDEPAERARALLNRACAYLLLGRLNLARADLLECDPLARRLGMTSVAIKVALNLGYYDLLAGNIPNALAMLDNAARRCVAELPSYLPVIMLDKARVLLAAGLADDADLELDRALTLLARQRLTEERAEAELARAQAALLADRPGPAALWAGRARRHFARRANSTWASLATLIEIRAAFAQGAAPLPLAQRSAAIAHRLAQMDLVDDARVAELFTARALLRAGDSRGAHRVVTGVGRLRRTDALEVRMLWWLTHAELADDRAQPRLRSRRLRAGLAWLQRHRGLLGSVDLQIAATAHGRELAQFAVHTALREGRPAAVFSWMERARAQAFRLTPVRPPADPAVARALEELRHIVYALRDAELRRDPVATRLRVRRGELERTIRERAWLRTGQSACTPPATLAATRAQLGDRAMVGYLRDGNGLSALALTERRTLLIRLGSYQEIAETHRRLLVDLDLLADRRLAGQTAGALLRSADRHGALLAQQVLAPVLPIVGDRDLVVLPTGVLHGVPWLRLPGTRGRPLVVAPSATAWLAANQRQARSGVDEGDRRPVLVAGPGIQHGERELALLAAIHPSATLLSGAEATVPATLAAADGAALVHLAAHGHHQPDNPLFSSIELTGGSLMGYDLQHVHQPPQHVVLSACEVGLSSIRHGDEILGMAAALLHAGSVTVIASVTRVADHTVPEMMDRYHRGLAEGSPPARALADASAHDVASPFVCFGAS